MHQPFPKQVLFIKSLISICLVNICSAGPVAVRWWRFQSEALIFGDQQTEG
jgi:hypothetical protein